MKIKFLALKLKSIMELSKKLRSIVQTHSFIDSELYSDIVELNILVNMVIDNLELYDSKELETIVNSLEDTLRVYTNKVKQEVI